MDWQQIVALSIVAMTVALFIWTRLRRRSSNLPCDTHCGCSSSAPSRQSVIYHTRKGERPEIIVKMR